MGVKERRERAKQEMREKILQSAHNLFLDRSFEEISIRHIAEAIEYSPATIYLYFKDKNEIFYALQGEAFRVFNTFVADVSAIPDSFARLSKLAEMYLEFSFAHPKYYTIMYIMESPKNSDENSENWRDGAQTLAFLERILEDCQQQGRFKNQEVKPLAFTIWSFMHGMCSLVLRNRMRIYSRDVRESIRSKSLNQFLQLLELS